MGINAISAINNLLRPVKTVGFTSGGQNVQAVAPKFAQRSCDVPMGNPMHPECRTEECGKNCYYLA